MEKQKLNEERLEAARKFSEEFMSLGNEVEIEKLIANNKIKFKSGEVTYRIRRPNSKDQEEAHYKTMVKYRQLVEDPNYLFKKQWKALYANMRPDPINIEELEADIEDYNDRIEELMLKLATSEDKKSIESLKNQIIELDVKLKQTSMELTDLLSYSIEDAILIFSNSYLTYLILEKLTEDKEWIRAFETFEDFQENEDIDLMKQAFYYTKRVIFG